MLSITASIINLAAEKKKRSGRSILREAAGFYPVSIQSHGQFENYFPHLRDFFMEVQDIRSQKRGVCIDSDINILLDDGLAWLRLPWLSYSLWSKRFVHYFSSPLLWIAGYFSCVPCDAEMWSGKFLSNRLYNYTIWKYHRILRFSKNHKQQRAASDGIGAYQRATISAMTKPDRLLQVHWCALFQWLSMSFDIWRILKSTRRRNVVDGYG